MPGRLLDTNAVIALFATDPGIGAHLSNKVDILVPIIAVGELFYGAEKSARATANRARVRDFITRRRVLLCDVETSGYYGQIKRALRLKGRPIPDNDIWIAAIALQHGLILVTRDSHFQEVDNLQIEGW